MNPEYPNDAEANGEVSISEEYPAEVLPDTLHLVSNINFAAHTPAELNRISEMTEQIRTALGGTTERTEAEISDTEIAKHANYLGNYSELLFSRMHDPEIRKQLLDLLEENEQWIAAHPPQVSEMQRDPITNEIITNDLDIPLFHYVPGTYTPKTRNELDAELEASIGTEMSVTPINPDQTHAESGSSHEDIMGDDSSPLNRNMRMGIKRDDYSIPLSPNEIRDRSMTEAHEKGHVLRHLKGSEYLEQRFSRAFDASTIDPDAFARSIGRPEGMTDQEVIDEAKNYLFKFERPSEIIERMSQLKNYFGLRGSERFTPAHLHYAQKHYLSDGMMDNHMQTFFDAITPETESAFIELINTVGV